MNIKEIIANAPEGAERYFIHPNGDVFYYKNSDNGFEYSWGDIWNSGAINWHEATPLPKPPYSAENPPPDGWEGEVKTNDGPWCEVFIHKSKMHIAQMGVSIVSKHQFRETPTPRERFIERVQAQGADFGAIYDEFVGGEM